MRVRTALGSPPNPCDRPEPTRLEEELELVASPLLATPPGAGAVRAAAEPVRELLPEAIRLGVLLNSPPDMPDPELPTEPDDPPELLDPEDPPLLEPPPPPDEPDAVAVPLDPLVRGTACPATAGAAIPTARRKVTVRIDPRLVMASSPCLGPVTCLSLCKSTATSWYVQMAFFRV